MKIPRLLAALLMAQAGHALAEDNAQGKGFWYAQTSVYTRHYSPDPEHNNHQDLIGIERNQASGWVFGGATFRNSFRQRSNYAYVGKRYDSSEYPLYLKVTGGLLQGYRGDYKDKIPLNRYGIAPVIIPSVGTHYGPLAAELVFLGANAAMVTSGVRF
ncbi:sn-glycerol-3-phosphate transporter [Pseudomonas sp. lyk4-TYG-107]|uniref:sn-glycerol-3-phosphate transporter n=1 Tax=Pseudomonas sp. lyk4-TYG-107 TaxID=3040317 RepID=UPI00255341C1|nr:sn-glycerol-3-phosphate transporter [Pseudomonas sp. lyk4-TYG-107]